jgi:hypothetical protein
VRASLPWLLPALLALPVTGARAQVAVQQWRPSTEPGGFTVLEPPLAPVSYGLGVALWGQYAREPVVLPRDGGAPTVVTDQLSVDLVGSIGLFDWLALSLDLPSTVFQGANLASIRRAYAGVGDPRLLARVLLLRPGASGRRFGLAFVPEMGVPLGDRLSLLSERNFTFTPRVALGYLAGPALLVANLGYRFREGTPLGTLFVDDEVLMGLGAEATLPQLPLGVAVELTAATAAARPFMDLQETSVEAFASLRARVGDVVFQPGLSLGVTPGYLVPDFRLFTALAFAPRYRDADGDGLRDDLDRCPTEREDDDGFRDSDGCPDLDNDGDTIPDRADRCPDAAGEEGLAGCPPAEAPAR